MSGLFLFEGAVWRVFSIVKDGRISWMRHIFGKQIRPWRELDVTCEWGLVSCRVVRGVEAAVAGGGGAFSVCQRSNRPSRGGVINDLSRSPASRVFQRSSKIERGSCSREGGAVHFPIALILRCRS